MAICLSRKQESGEAGIGMSYYKFTCPPSFMWPQAKDMQVKFIHELSELLTLHAASPVLWWYVKAKKEKYSGVSIVQVAEEATLIFRSLPKELPPYIRLHIDAYGQTEDLLSDQKVEDLICSTFDAAIIRPVGRIRQ